MGTLTVPLEVADPRHRHNQTDNALASPGRTWPFLTASLLGESTFSLTETAGADCV